MLAKSDGYVWVKGICGNFKEHEYGSKGFFNFVSGCFSVFKLYLSLIGNFQASCSESCSHESTVQPIFDY